MSHSPRHVILIVPLAVGFPDALRVAECVLSGNLHVNFGYIVFFLLEGCKGKTGTMGNP